MKFLPALAPLLLLASCGFNSTVVSLDYEPRLSQGIPGPRDVSVGRFADMRATSAEHTLGTVRSPIGTHMETLVTRVPVEDVVRNAFAHGLKSRGMLAGTGEGACIISGEVLDLECNQMLRASAFARVRVNLVRPGSGRIIYSRVFQSSRQGGTYAPGSGSPVPHLTELASRALQNIVDRALDDRELRSRLRDLPPEGL